MKEITFVYMGVMPDARGTGETFTGDIFSEPLHQAASLEQAGFALDFRNYTGFAYRDPLGDPGNLVDFLGGCRNLLYLFTYVFSLPYAIAALMRLKQKRPAIKIVLGGIGPNCAPRELLNAFPFVDALVLGEGEQILPALFESLFRGSHGQVAGVCYRSDTEIHCTPPPERVSNPDSLPPAAYHLLDLKPHERINLLFSRGCPCRCTFCDDLAYWRGKRVERSVPDVLAELKRLAEIHGVSRCIISDDLFSLGRERAIAFSRGLRELDLGFRWEILTRIDCLDEETMREMAESGCFSIMVGIESGSKRILERVKKNLSLEHAVENLRRARRHFERVITFFIWGWPFEELEDFNETLTLMAYLSERLGCDVRLNSLIPFQNTPLFRDYGSTIFFSEEYVPFDKSRFYIKGETRELAKNHPGIFASFHTYETPHFEEKKKILRKLFNLECILL